MSDCEANIPGSILTEAGDNVANQPR